MTLLNLADRVEAAGGADRDLDALVFGLCVALLRTGVIADDETPAAPGGIADHVPRYTASLDAARSLVPAGYGWRLWVPCGPQLADGDRPRVTMWGPLRAYAPNDSEAATPALALTAACLRAIAHAGDPS